LSSTPSICFCMHIQDKQVRRPVRLIATLTQLRLKGCLPTGSEMSGEARRCPSSGFRAFSMGTGPAMASHRQKILLASATAALLSRRGRAATRVPQPPWLQPPDPAKSRPHPPPGPRRPILHVHGCRRCRRSRHRKSQSRIKNNVFATGFLDGAPATRGCSAKGKFWSISRVRDLTDWIDWCEDIGRSVNDPASRQTVFSRAPCGRARSTNGRPFRPSRSIGRNRC
jgi:hypothetical protein